MLCFVVVMQLFIMNSHEVFIHIHQGCFAGTGAIVRLPQCQWSKPDGYGKITQCITTTKHIKAKTVCIFLGILGFISAGVIIIIWIFLCYIEIKLYNRMYMPILIITKYKLIVLISNPSSVIVSINALWLCFFFKIPYHCWCFFVTSEAS